MTNWLDELDAAAERAQNAERGGTPRAIERLRSMRDACSPERIRALIACVRAAQHRQSARMERYGDVARAAEKLDAALAALEATP